MYKVDLRLVEIWGFMNGILRLILHQKIHNNKGVNEKAIIQFFYNGDMDGCWLHN